MHIHMLAHSHSYTAAQFPGPSAEKPRVLEAAELRR